ncbi:4a-hydroxytetrahydrobiopterin dehydratase [Aquibacillus sp. 3ASR75-54]|uniref:4a-hydroxytetrahydrobiopterin dehydratase n=1 Tax=Aquibacillus salsiterrae TaxID=2950439 RepID=A0A9X3WBZ0_9BACI|nr:4a-hydroxytetrahydrobiopterin dehydratase [Aquibacillus salsiterrae]MDC3416927.1 4a-hydroxytetrahydrobiopterin dehydratase [Aquibacillus salsiterrae]
MSEELANLVNWKRVDNKWIEGNYRFKEYLTGVNFVQEIAKYAEEMNHHPFITIEYKRVTVKLSSWRAKGITDLDIEMANRFNAIYLGK